MTLRHGLSILLLPFLVVVGVPYALLDTLAAGDTRWGDASLWAWLPRSAGALLFVAGLALFGWCVSLFARVGRGTLAPWDPAHHLVAVGPYRHVRNPMIGGVALMLLAQALLWGSAALAIWAGGFVLINHVYFVLWEEPGLERRFGENYRVYKANVPRWIPRLRSRKNNED
jgi:protein-S-isoprenylcysteine O-methyltransferase Ste14